MSLYNRDRSWSDQMFYGDSQELIISILNESKLFGQVDDYKPSSVEDDNNHCIDTDINNIPCQIRLQQLKKIKNINDYQPTIRAYRSSGSETELRKFIKYYPKYIKGERCMPKYLIWILINGNQIIKLKIVNILDIIRDRYYLYNKDKSYRMIEDKDKYDYKENSDGTHFLVLKWGIVFSYP